MKCKSIMILFLIFTGLAAFSQDDVRVKAFNLDASVAVQGYDPVAYFKLGKAVKGDKGLGAVAFGGVKYYFSSVENKETFKKSPASFEPQYGGWCAFAMGNDGSKVNIDPETFKITGGKLYLFYNKLFTNTLKSWNKNEVVLKKQADVNWAKLFH